MLDTTEGKFSIDEITEFINLMQLYEGAMYEVSTKLEILDDEFQVRFSHDPIHHMERRLKSIKSIIGKLQRRGLPISIDSVRDNLFDVAGIRVICNYRDDVYSVSNYLSSQSDIQVLRVKDYIKSPKQNGSRCSSRPASITCRWRSSSVPSRWITGRAWSMRCAIRATCPTPSWPSIRRPCWTAHAACRTSKCRCRTSTATSMARRGSRRRLTRPRDGIGRFVRYGQGRWCTNRSTGAWASMVPAKIKAHPR